jgi:glycosyltransferase involved in cell wall biosynthesis
VNASKKRILMVQHAGGLGGSAVSLRQLAVDLQAQGHSPIIALARPTDSLFGFYRKVGLETLAAADIRSCDHSTVAPRPFYLPSTHSELARLLVSWRSTGRAVNRLADKTRADIVHLNSMPLMAAAEGLRKSGRPFVWHVREPAPDQGLRTRFIRRIMKRTSAKTLIFLSEYDARSWLGMHADEDYHYQVLPNAIPDAWLTDVNSAEHIAGQDDVVRFGFFGGFSPFKGDALLLNALDTLRRRNRHWRCILWNTVYLREERCRLSLAARVAGSAGLATRFDKMLAGFTALRELVEFRRFTNDIPTAMREIAFVVFPARVPHFPRPVIEAAAFGRPAIATCLGGLDDSIVAHETGILTRAGDAAELAAAIERMIEDHGLRNQMGRKAKQRADALHRQSRLTAAILKTYDEAGDQTSKP